MAASTKPRVVLSRHSLVRELFFFSAEVLRSLRHPLEVLIAFLIALALGAKVPLRRPMLVAWNVLHLEAEQPHPEQVEQEWCNLSMGEAFRARVEPSGNDPGYFVVRDNRRSSRSTYRRIRWPTLAPHLAEPHATDQ